MTKQRDLFHLPRVAAPPPAVNEAITQRDEKARALLHAGRPAEAAAEWRALAAALPASAELRYRLGVALRAAGDAPGAIEAYRAALGLDAGHADAANNLGNLLSGVGRFGEAIRALESAVRLRPRDASIRSNLGAARQG
ncbi:MAG: tetratricopeptide repeat protein, partial [Alphaproteobacteria bacterium]|nr:tetratricopeptide repeat protein [Alphaproteobacteria bacterium]